MSAFEWMKRLHREELYEDLIHLGSFLVPSHERSVEANPSSQRCQIMAIYADGLFHLEQYRKSEHAFYKALQICKSSNRPLDIKKKQADSIWNETEIRFQLHKCLLKQQKQQEAMGVLDSIVDRERTPKVRAALARLYSEQEKRSSGIGQLRKKGPSRALENYKRLLQSVPFAFNSLVGYLHSGGRLSDFTSSPTSDELDWLPCWLDAQEALSRRDLVLAARGLRDLLSKYSAASNNARAVTELGRCYYTAGERTKVTIIVVITIVVVFLAMNQLQRAHSLDPYDLHGMDILASLLCEERKTKELESLATKLMTDNAAASETWIALGLYLCRAQNKPSKALYFAHKACDADDSWKPSSSAMLLKGRVLMDSKRYPDAAQHFHEALLYDRECFELYEGLVQCQLEQNKMKEARLIARSCREAIGSQEPRPMTLAASVLSRDPSTVTEARAMLETAVASAPFLLNAVYLLVDLYDRQCQFDQAIALLRSQTQLHVNSKLHRLLGDFLSKTNRAVEAVDNYRHAQTLDPTDHLAQNCLQSLDSLPSSFATPDVSFPTTAAFTTELTMAPRRMVQAHETLMDDEDSSSDYFNA